MIIRRSFLVVIAAAVVMAALPAAAQAPVAPAPKPLGPKVPASAALKQIPAGCMGFVVVNNVNGMCGKVENFLKSIGPGGMPLLPMGVLDMVKTQLQLGKGFNSNGPFVLVMLDAQLYGVDLLQMLNLPGAKPAPGAEKQPEVPAVILIPGKDPAKIFAAREGKKEGDYLKIGGMYWRQAGSFVAGSPSKKALAAVAAVRKSVLTQLSPADKALIARNDAAVWLNFKIVGPIAQAALKKLEKAAAEEGAAAAKMAGMGPALAMYGALVKELEDVALGLRFAKTGILIESRVSFLADSSMGKALAATKVLPGGLLDRLPTTPYIVAMGFRGTVVPKDLNAQMLDKFMAAGMLKGLSAETKAKWRKMTREFQDQVTGVQFSAGAITGGEGLVGLVYVIECKSADKVRALLPDNVGMVSEVYKASGHEVLSKIKIKYHKGLEAVGTQKLDAITVDHPDLAQMDESGRAKLKTILGDDKIRLLVGKADAKTLVITLGGGKEFLDTAMKTAKARSGKLRADPGTATALAMLPKKRMGVGLLNVGNIMTVVKKVAAAVGETPPSINLIAPTPLAGSMSIEKSDMLLVGYIPTDAIQGIVGAVMGVLMGRMMGGPGPGPPPGF